VQSFSETEKFDSGHQEVLETIAAQAAVAIQNARLYAHTDQALARRVQQLDSILRATQEGVLLLDSNHKVLAANGALVDFLGITQAELQDVYAYQSLEPGGRSLLDQLEYSWDVLRGDCQALTDEVGGFRKRVVTLPGPPQRHLEHTLTAVRNQEGGVDGWLLVFRDLTDEIELARLQEDMLHMVVHDIRSPLAVLRGGLGVLRTSLGEGDLEQNLSMLDLAQRGSERIMRLVNQLLDVNRLEKGPIALKLEPLDLHTPLREIYEEFQPVVSMDHIGLVLSLPDELPQVRADAQHVTRIFYNLVDNAVKFTPDGGQIELRAYAEPPGAPGWVTVRVSDSGGGIPEEALPRLFQKYEQVSGANGRRSGTGLGLYYCKLATEAQGGQIWAESGDYSGESPGSEAGGSRFYVRLPIASQGG
jgi:signal transduction histidine kinase